MPVKSTEYSDADAGREREREIVYHTMGVLLRLNQLKLKCSQPNSRHHFMCLLFWMNEDTHAKSMSERLWMRSKWKMFQRHRWNGQNDLNRHHGWRHECTLNDYECSSNALFPVEGLLKAHWRQSKPLIRQSHLSSSPLSDERWRRTCAPFKILCKTSLAVSFKKR